MFYTGNGDKGVSQLSSSCSVPKSDPAMGVLGSLDELNSLLGLVRNKKISTQAKKELRNVQEKLFIIQAYCAYAMMKMQARAPKISAAEITRVEKAIDTLEKKVNPGKHFIIPGATESSAYLDYARALCRRVEREMVILSKKNKRYHEPIILTYLNRLSSLFYALARFEVKQSGKKENKPKYK